MDNLRTCLIGKLTVLNVEQTAIYHKNVAILKLFCFCGVYSVDSKEFFYKFNKLLKNFA